MSTALLAAIHYIALAIGFAGICLRFKALSSSRVGAPLQPLYLGDNLWGVAALLWIATGLLRAFGGFEKGTAFYMESVGFWVKMGLFLLVFVIEFRPMLTFILWRRSKKSEIRSEDLPLLQSYARASGIQIGLILIMPIVASLMARGLL